MATILVSAKRCARQEIGSRAEQYGNSRSQIPRLEYRFFCPRKDPETMMIVRQPYYANILPQHTTGSQPDALWRCVIRRDGSPEILVRHEARRKEDAASRALAELLRLQAGERKIAQPA